MNESWLSEHPNDLLALSNYAEKHFTTGNFHLCEARISLLLANEKVNVGVKIALRAIQVANLLALDRSCDVGPKLTELTAAVSAQEAEFNVDWSFEGTKDFINHNEKLSRYKDWSKLLFAEMEAVNRDGIVAGLKTASAGFSCSK